MDFTGVTLDVASYLAGSLIILSAFAAIWGAKRVISLFSGREKVVWDYTDRSYSPGYQDSEWHFGSDSSKPGITHHIVDYERAYFEDNYMIK
jgi:hypothetical protein